MRARAIWLLVLSLVPALAWGASQPDREAAGLTGPHDLRTSRAGQATCSFCHTPEGTPGAAPRWARTASAASFASFDLRDADGGIRVSGPNSVVCLTCHDGVQAREVSADMPMTAPMRGRGGLATGDHPVGIPFSGEISLTPDASGRVQRLQRETIGGRESWWLDLEPVPNGRRDKTDAILFARAGGGAAAPALQPFVECATCHDPHGRPDRMMLRNPEAGSDLCLACHDR